MYKTFSRSHLDYCDVIYHQAAKITKDGQALTSLMNDVERVQYRGALVVTGTHGKARIVPNSMMNWVGNRFLTVGRNNA